MKYRVIVHLIREHEKDAKDVFLKQQIGKHKPRLNLETSFTVSNVKHIH